MTPRITALPATSRLTRLLYRYGARRFGAGHRDCTPPWTADCGALHEAVLERASTTRPTSVWELAVYWTVLQIGCSRWVGFGAMLIRRDGLDRARLEHRTW